jgi:hypothetical protein
MSDKFFGLLSELLYALTLPGRYSDETEGARKAVIEYVANLEAENARLHSILVDIFKFTACPSDRKWSDYSYSVLGARLDEIAKLVSPPEVS